MIEKTKVHLVSNFLGKEDITCFLADMPHILISEYYLD